MNRIVIVCLIFSACLISTTSEAMFVIDQATFTPADCNAPALASAPDGITMLAYWASGDPLLQDFVQVQKIPTRGTGSSNWSEPLVLGSGSHPAICWSRTGFHCAFASGPVILIFHSDLDGNWDMENYTTLPTGDGIISIDMLGIASDAAGPDVFLTAHIFHNGAPSSDEIVFSARHFDGWSDLETVVDSAQYVWPKLTWSIGPAGPYPLIFFLESGSFEMQLKSVYWDPMTGWGTPALVPGSLVGQEFDVVRSYGIHVLGLGPAPTCPCGSISYQIRTDSSGWQEPEDMTAHYAEYDWPKSPKIVHDSDFNVHAFWMQYSTASDFTPWRNTLEYRVLEDGVWTDEGDFLDEPGHGPPLGARVAITAFPSAYPVLAWTRRDTINSVPQPMQIWIARQQAPAAAPEPNIVQPKLALTAWPNPFNPLVNLAFELDRTQSVRLDVFDARGRRVAGLLDGLAESGRTEISWAGKDNSGRSLPSGVYFARLITGSEKAVFKLMLTE